jgi:hypothetical protein
MPGYYAMRYLSGFLFTTIGEHPHAEAPNSRLNLAQDPSVPHGQLCTACFTCRNRDSLLRELLSPLAEGAVENTLSIVRELHSPALVKFALSAHTSV